MNHNTTNMAIPTLVPEAVYTDRQEHLEYLYTTAIRAISRRSMSTVLLGQRRMGKTEIFKRVVNRLFFEQEQPADLQAAVVPVYFSFPDSSPDKWVFCTKYVENFLRWYAAFRLQERDLLFEERVSPEAFLQYLHNTLPLSPGLKGALNVYSALLERDLTLPEEWALWLPRRVSDRDGATIAVFLDEFQNTRLPQYNFDIVGFLQEAVESPSCPHFVTGSAMSILGQEILGRGALYGRFDHESIRPMTEYWGSELVLRAAAYYQVQVPEHMAPVIAGRCGGNPFYITALIRQAFKQKQSIENEDQMNDLLAVDLSSGFIWGELSDQVQRWIERINEYGISKWILYLAALEEGEKIDLERIQRQMEAKQGTRVEVETIHTILVKLARGDLLEYLELGGWFRKLRDPILVDFLRVWGRIEVEGQEERYVTSETVKRYQRQHKQIADQKGYLAEVYLAQILWNLQRRTLPGPCVHQNSDVQLPDQFFYIKHRVRLGQGKGQEIDVYAAAGADVWIAESKWWTERKVGRLEVEAFWSKRPLVLEFEGPDLRSLQMWFFSHSGFTPEAEAFLQDKGILYSEKDDLNALLDLAGHRRLPEL
ncbi:MAG: hypothetical protein K9J81_09420 [Desulfohalobiaceae bacterium]|nr:hypothetical protein [Desulfohalobiaceae bacterium]